MKKKKKKRNRKNRFRLTLEPIVEEGPLTRQRAREVTFINPPKPKIIMTSKLKELEEKKRKGREEKKRKRKGQEKSNAVASNNNDNNNESAMGIENQTANKDTVSVDILDIELIPSLKKKRNEEEETNANNIESSGSNNNSKK